jgi:hypothetical protein
MQDLAIEYDLSFFDTDPYEPIAGMVLTKNLASIGLKS